MGIEGYELGILLRLMIIWKGWGDGQSTGDGDSQEKGTRGWVDMKICDRKGDDMCFGGLSIYYFKIMQKKQQPQKGQAGKNKLQTVIEQNDPYLRSLQKKIRNLNKKLTEIADLEGKDNLKPEQIEKIARKQIVLDEIAKIEENASFFKEVYAQNLVHYRNQQLKELDTLARALALYHAGTTHDHPKLQALWRAIELADHQGTLNQATETIAQALRDFANDYKLQKNLAKHHEAHGESALKGQKQPEQQIVKTISEEKPVKKEEPQPVPEVVEAPKEKAPEPEAPVQQPVAQVEETVQEVPKEEPKVQTAKVEGKRGEKRDRPYREKDANRGANRERKEDVKRQYKPKYEEKKPEGEVRERDDSVSSSSSDEKARQFRKEEIHKLQDEGFIMVGKPKPKPKDVVSQQKFHDRVHGNKNHHHHHGKNT